MQPVSAKFDDQSSRIHAWDRYWSEVYRPGEERPGNFTRWAVPFLHRSAARAVVDLGCGPGRDLGYLALEGFVVTGVDESPVALSLARGALTHLPRKARSRVRLVRAGLLGYLSSRTDASVDAVHASATYQGLADGELTRVFEETHRVLKKNGLHLWSVRNGHHIGRLHPESIPPNFPALGYTVPLRFFSREEVDRCIGRGFERLELQEVEPAPGFFSFFIADRKV